MSALSPTKDKYVKKHHAAIHSSSQLTLLQRKLANCLLFKAYNNLLTEDYHDINIQELMKLLEIKTNSYYKLKESILKLMSTVIEWNVLDKNDGDEEFSSEIWKASTLLSSVQIQGTQIKYEYSKTLRDLFYRPSGYTRIKLTMQNKFRSAYSLAMYENCLRFVNVGSTGWLSLETFRKIMGVSKDQYKIFRDLNRRVLKPAIQEINEISDINIEYQLKKVNNNPVKIKLIIGKDLTANNGLPVQDELDIESCNPEDSSIFASLIKLGVADKLALEILSQYEPKFIQEKINFVLLYPGVVKNPVGILIRALQNNYPIVTNNSELKNASSTDVREQEEANRIKKDHANLRKQYNVYIDGVYREWIGNMTTEERALVRNKLKLFIESGNHVMPKVRNIIDSIDSDDQFENLSAFTALKIFVNSISNEEKINIKPLSEIKPTTFEQYVVGGTILTSLPININDD